jgi:ketosteroid isomerase-like protein
VHPGGGRKIGAGAIRATFEAMFSNGSVQAFPERMHKVQSLASSVHHLVERVEINTPQGPKQAYVIATNVYHLTPQGWRMVAHHASPGTPGDVADAGLKPTVFH